MTVKSFDHKIDEHWSLPGQCKVRGRNPSLQGAGHIEYNGFGTDDNMVTCGHDTGGSLDDV